ncbi:MAG: NAD-dependent epimerase/dehydratase family protein [Chthoniobacteraceae bacterium]
MKALVTGGAGFIGSHIVDHLIERGADVTVYDNLCTGFETNVGAHLANPKFRLVKADVLDKDALKAAMEGCDTVFHFQANADVRGGTHKTRIDLEQNTIATWNVLDAMRENGVKTLAFASSATVYGEPEIFPTPEDCPLVQTSLYGASKLAGEAMIQAYAEYFGIRSVTFRFVSWIGPRYSHGVVYDFMKKLRANPQELEVLGDGKQRKSYLDVRDGVAGVFTALDRYEGNKGVFNLGHDDFMNVLDLAAIVTSELGLKDVKLVTTGGERGWLGDSPFVQLDTARMKSLGWTARISIEEGIRATVRHLIENPELIEGRK